MFFGYILKFEVRFLPSKIAHFPYAYMATVSHIFHASYCRVVAREFLVPGDIYGNFCEIDNFIENCPSMAKFYVILQFLTLECWVLELKLFVSGGL